MSGTVEAMRVVTNQRPKDAAAKQAVDKTGPDRESKYGTNECPVDEGPVESVVDVVIRLTSESAFTVKNAWGSLETTHTTTTTTTETTDGALTMNGLLQAPPGAGTKRPRDFESGVSHSSGKRHAHCVLRHERFSNGSPPDLTLRRPSLEHVLGLRLVLPKSYLDMANDSNSDVQGPPLSSLSICATPASPMASLREKACLFTPKGDAATPRRINLDLRIGAVVY